MPHGSHCTSAGYKCVLPTSTPRPCRQEWRHIRPGMIPLPVLYKSLMDGASHLLITLIFYPGSVSVAKRVRRSDGFVTHCTALVHLHLTALVARQGRQSGKVAAAAACLVTGQVTHWRRSRRIARPRMQRAARIAGRAQAETLATTRSRPSGALEAERKNKPLINTTRALPRG